MADIQIISDAGRDACKRRLVLCRCTCGGEFTARRDHAKAGRVKRCPDCRHQHEEAAPNPAEATATPAPPAPAATPAAEGGLQPEHGSAEWHRAQISSKEKTLATLEAQAADLELLIQKEGILPSDGMAETPDRIWNRVTTMVSKLRKELAKHRKELLRIEAAKAAPLNAREAYRAKIQAVKQGAQ